jgi:hypothetical protein
VARPPRKNLLADLGGTLQLTPLEAGDGALKQVILHVPFLAARHHGMRVRMTSRRLWGSRFLASPAIEAL